MKSDGQLVFIIKPRKPNVFKVQKHKDRNGAWKETTCSSRMCLRGSCIDSKYEKPFPHFGCRPRVLEANLYSKYIEFWASLQQLFEKAKCDPQR